MSTWLEGSVVENRHWTEALFSLRVEGAPLAFEAGQFVRVALDIDGERVARAFSMVNAPADPLLEFYGIVVPQGPLSPRLARLRPGERLYVASNPAGFLVVSELPAAETLWLMSTGTGIAPFISMLRAAHRGSGSATSSWSMRCATHRSSSTARTSSGLGRRTGRVSRMSQW